MKVFISYTLRDSFVSKEFLIAVSSVVSEFAIPFVDILHNHSDNKQAYVMEQLDSSNIVLLISTPSIVKSEWVMTEVMYANKQLIPIISIPLKENGADLSLEKIKKTLPVELNKLVHGNINT
jgi:hypothetical protein